MKTEFHPAESRGRGDHEWLTTRYSFSFADWYEPGRMGFGALRVLNDDRIAPASGFPPHSHRDMEIITIVTKGTLTHKDSLGNVGTVSAGDVQVMSAGTGVTHAEYNDSSTEPLELFQVWVAPNARGLAPRYDQRHFGFDAALPGLTPLIGAIGDDGVLGIHQRARISYASVDSSHPINLELKEKEGSGAYVFVVEGSAIAAGQKLSARDALGVSETNKFAITTNQKAALLIIEVPVPQGMIDAAS